jgi:hypothetical protein
VEDPFVLVSITASPLKGEIVYKVGCSNTLTNEEFEHYLQEITKAIVKWWSGACQPKIQSFQEVGK